MKFTIDDIKAEHAKVKSGADFPQYIRALKELGVSRYITYVSDQNTDYFDEDNQLAATRGENDPVRSISGIVNLEEFTKKLKLHQQGGTDYPTFCTDCAQNGIEGWKMDLNAMTCTYFDKEGNDVLTENIPG
ncbi:MAG: DUF1398 domain-containing protein [Chryseobacterium sp.]|jgi:uncharacterized protein YbcV (DUF1398 family)|uniref:DUF1398 domain-containing protein n=1 Tax=Chryseobacterium sp. TaxID=1871047 RepID=UPI002836070F|nr:DUF1398 family protein [Chryseobacterium sp.]MDR2236188.1 DUF1398 domain-containing protein [Chryseobacterium sp.]